MQKEGVQKSNTGRIKKPIRIRGDRAILSTERRRTNSWIRDSQISSFTALPRTVTKPLHPDFCERPRKIASEAIFVNRVPQSAALNLPPGHKHSESTGHGSKRKH